jgi:hypothetical protein
LSSDYLDKDPISALRSIAATLQDAQPGAIFDVADDPRIQYPDAAIKEGIDILKTMRDPKTLKSKRRNPIDGVPRSFGNEEMPRTGA